MHTPHNKALRLAALGALAMLLTAGGCASQKTPAVADVAASRATLDSAGRAGAAELAPAEMASARDKLMRANQALAAKDYRTARELAGQAQADAALAQSKADSDKASMAATELQRSIQALRDELERSRATQQQ